MMINASSSSPGSAADDPLVSSQPRLRSRRGFAGWYWWILSALLIFVLLLTLPGAQANTITVTSIEDGAAGSLRAALLSATAGDTIRFNSSLKNETIALSGSALAISQNVNIVGPGAGVLSINANYGSGVFTIAASCNVNISGLTICGGENAATDGGGIYNQGNLVLNQCYLYKNSASGAGGAIASSGSLTLTSCTVSSCSSGTAGGGISSSGALVMSQCTISGNGSFASGGGLFNSGSATISACTFSDNGAYDSTDGVDGIGDGGGIYNDGPLFMVNCTIANNVSGFFGGGVYNDYVADLIFNSEEWENVTGAMDLVACTVSGNQSVLGGGICDFGDGMLDSCIVAGNSIVEDVYYVGSQSPDLWGGFYSLGYNVIGTTSNEWQWDTWFILSGSSTVEQFQPQQDLIANPKLNALANNGGPTQTMSLQAGSPAINNGDDSITQPPMDIQYDQRGSGYPRQMGQHVDSGAFESPYSGPNVKSVWVVSYTGTSATVSAQVNPNGNTTKVQFLLNSQAVNSVFTIGAGGVQTVTTTIENLRGHTLYSVNARASNSYASSTGSAATFTTLDNPPVARNTTAILVGGSATVSLQNFVSDIDGDTLSIQNVASTTGTWNYSGLIVNYISSGTGGGDSFIYTVSDPMGLTSTGTVTLIPGNILLSQGSLLSWMPAQGYTLGKFGVPAISDSNGIACITTMVDGKSVNNVTAVVAGTSSSVIAFQNEQVPNSAGTGYLLGAQFLSFGDPIIDDEGNVAFLAKITGPAVTKGKNDIGIWTNAPDGVLRLARRTGDAVQSGSASTATVAAIDAFSLQEVSMVDGQGNAFPAAELIYSANLANSAKAVNAATKSGIWSRIISSSSNSDVMLVRAGVSTASGTTIKSFEAFNSLPVVAGQSRSYTSPGTVTFLATLAGGHQAIIDATTQSVWDGTPGELEVLALSGSSTGGTEGGNWVTLGSPASDVSNPSAISFLGEYQTSSTTINANGKIKVTKTNHTGIFLGQPQSGGTTAFNPVALVGGTISLSGTAGPVATFTGFHNPVLVTNSTTIAFVATMKGAKIPAGQGTGIWWGTSGSLSIAAQTGVRSSYLPVNTTFQSFNSVALPPGLGVPIFVATLGGAGANASNNTGLWTLDGSGNPKQLLRTGEPIFVNGEQETLKTFAILGVGVAPSSPGVTRSFNGTNQVVFRAVFKDNSEAVISLAIQ